ITDREEIDRLTARLGRIETLQRDYDRICAELAAVVLSDEIMQRIERAAAAVDRTGDQLVLMSAAVEFTAVADIELAIGSRRMSFSAGRSLATTLTAATEVELPGRLTARITPGATALDVQAKHDAAQQVLAEALAAGAIAD